ncbi:MAG TPA: DNA repair protein RecN, partial [Nitrolancea sp.]|nr:DNA repair protein RecN [Nitrolancea sp.]
GQRTSAELVRSGEASAFVEAVFDVEQIAARPELQALLQETGVEPEDGTLVLTRDINASGRSTARVNGRTVTAATLAALGGLLVDIHGQSDHLSLLRPALHLDLLDRYAGTLPEREALAGRVTQFQSVRRRIDAILSGERERAQRFDLLRFQVEEIGAARLQPDEEESLERERAVLSNAERLARLAAEAYQLLEGGDLSAPEPAPGALDNLRLAVDRVEELASIDRDGEALAGPLREALFLLEDATQGVRAYAETVEADPARLEAIEDRLALFRQLKRKYGAGLPEIIAFGERAAAELDTLEHGEEQADELRERAEELKRAIAAAAVALSEQRRAAAGELEQAVEQAIAELNMGRARFVVDFGAHSGGEPVALTEHGQAREVRFDSTGIDRVEFLIAPNAGEEPRPLARIASGGETARLMLALKSILSAADETPSLVFDEVDVGVGGRSGQPVGEKLWSLGDRHQVLVISHLPQVAAFAQAHYRITKIERAGRTETQVDRLDDTERLDELAAMLDGQPVTEASRENARAMLARIERWKRSAATAGVR